MGSGIGSKTCKWLATSDFKSTRCSNWKMVIAHCYKTCTACAGPTAQPTVSSSPPTEQSKTELPTLSPTSVTTKTPSKSPIISTNSPTQICEDKEGKVSMGSGIGSKTCKWLATSDFKSTRCSNWKMVIAHCYKTCTACAGPTAQPTVSSSPPTEQSKTELPQPIVPTSSPIELSMSMSLELFLL